MAAIFVRCRRLISYLSDERSGEQDADGRVDVGEVGDRRQQRRRLELVHHPALREGRERHQRPLKPEGSREEKNSGLSFAVGSARLQLADRWGRTYHGVPNVVGLLPGLPADEVDHGRQVVDHQVVPGPVPVEL